MHKLILATSLTLITAAGSACATKGFVNTRVGDVNTKVNTLTGAVEETQARTKANEGKISEVDKKAAAARAAADSAAGAASAADAKAGDAATAANAAKEVGVRADAKTDALAAASRRLVFEVVLSEDQGKFKLNAAELPAEVKVRIDDLVNQLKADPKGVYFEIEGHTDATGSPIVNDKLGLERADAVKRYLYEAHQIPLHKINIISFGEKKPVAPNNTREGRAQNRRVVIRVLA